MIFNAALENHQHNRITENQQLLSQLNKEDVWLDVGKWNQNSMKDICKFVREWNIQKLWAGSNQNANILKEISHIQFHKLIWINVPFNNISSVEGLHQIYLPSLKSLYIDRNDIHEISDLRKMRSFDTEILSIWRNKINQASTITLVSGQIQSISIQFWSQMCPDISWIAKLQSVKLNQIYIDSNRRIKCLKLQSAIRRKYGQIQIWSKD